MSWHTTREPDVCSLPPSTHSYIEAIKNITASGVIDGFFGDKWAKGASQNKNGSWSICNKECGSVTASQVGESRCLGSAPLAVRSALPWTSSNVGAVNLSMSEIVDSTISTLCLRACDSLWGAGGRRPRGTPGSRRCWPP